MNEETKKYVDFLKDEAESIRFKIKPILPKNYDEFEIIYFISFTMCDLLQAINLPDEKHWNIVNEFLKSHLFMGTIATMPKPPEHIAFLNEKSIVQSDRMNEYKNSYPLAEGIVKNVDTMVKKFVNHVSIYVCSNNADVDLFSNNLFPIIKEYSMQHIDSLRKMAGWKNVTGIVDIMVSQEKQIQTRIQEQIADRPNEQELYYYAFYLINSFYQKLDITNEKILSEYSNKSLYNYINASLNDFENDAILNKRTKRYEDYEIMWNQIEYDDEREKSTKMAMYFGFASKYIYGNKLHMMTLTILHPDLLAILSEGVNSYFKAVTDAIRNPKTSLSDRIKSFFK